MSKQARQTVRHLICCLLAGLAHAPAIEAASKPSLIREIAFDAESAAINVTFGCPLRYLAHEEQTVDKSLSIRFLALSACRQILPHLGQPPSLAQAGETLMGVQLEKSGNQEVIVHLTFIENGSFLVTQGSATDQVSITNRSHVLDQPPPSANEPSREMTNEFAHEANAESSANSAKESEPAAAVTEAASAHADTRLAQARSKILKGDYEGAIEIYVTLLENPNSQVHSEALEYLAVAYQMSGRVRLAIERYETWLSRFEEPADRQRVQQRLDALVAAQSSSASSRTSRNAIETPWQFYAAFGQDIWSFESQSQYADFDVDTARKTIADSYLDVGTTYRGEHLAVTTRANLGFQTPISTSQDSDTDNTAYARRAYVDLSQTASGASVRVGRQNVYGDGVLGLFDGVRGSYFIKDDLKINVTAGLPVDNPRYAADSSRQFIGASIDFVDIFRKFDANFYTHVQQADGVWDRQAIGSMWQRRGQGWHAIARIDYDVSYDVLNTAFIDMGARVNGWLRANARVNFYTAPYVGTSNALIGQQVATIDQLLDAYTDEQLRTIARNRTTDVAQFGVGLSADLGQRWITQMDSTYSKIDETVASAGVVAKPRATQIDTAVQLIGGSVFKQADSFILGYRLFSDQRADSHTASLDWRFKLAQNFRINPRISVVSRISEIQGEQTIFAPALRVMYLWRRNSELSAEVSARWSDRTLPVNDPFMLGLEEMTEENQEIFFYLQWRVDL